MSVDLGPFKKQMAELGIGTANNGHDPEDVPDFVREMQRELEQKKQASQGGLNGQVPHVEFPADKQRPCFRAYGKPFLAEGKLQEPGIYLHTFEEEKGEHGTKKVPINVRFLSYLKVLSIVRAEDGQEHSYLIEYAPTAKLCSSAIFYRKRFC